MPFTDKVLTCSDCGSSFTFTSGEQEFHQEKGFTNEPRRCQSCRSVRKSESGGAGGGRSDRPMFSAICSSCGKEARLPFEPRGDKPVYCSDCFKPQPRSNTDGYGGGGNYGGGASSSRRW
jgi:CxxC-x17-CxxC domain-containing protein